MKKKENLIRIGARKGITLCAAALIATGCADINVPEGGNGAGRVPLRVTGGINVQSRAHSTEWNEGDQIGIYTFHTGTTDIAEGVENILYRTEAGDGNFTPANTAAYYPVDGESIDLHAWYPYTDVTENEWTADLTDQTSQSAIDLMTADAPSRTGGGEEILHNKDNPTVSLKFNHRLTKLALTIKHGNGINATDLQGLRVEVTNQWKTVLYAPRFDTLGFTEELASIPLLTTSDGTSAEAILFPDDLTGKEPTPGRRFAFTLGTTGEVFYWDIPGKKSFNAGEKNLYTITINRIGLDVTSQITDWTAGNGDGEEGSAE